MGIRDFIRNRVNRMAEGMDVFKKDVFELEGVPAFREYYTLFIFVWQAIYKGFYQAWHEVNMKTVRDPKGKKRRMATMNAGSMVSAQMARYVWTEQCKITVSRDGVEIENDPLNEYLQEVLEKNGFWNEFGDLLEKSFALGGCALKEWVEIPKDENGNDTGEGRVKIGYTMATQFVPTAWDNNKVKAGIFISREARDGYYYTIVEWHRLDGTVYRVTNDLYRMPIKGAEPQNILGWWYPLDKIYPLLSPDTTINNVENAFFQYIKPFGANFADDNSPIGMSVFARGLDTLHGLDIMFDSYQREFVLGKKRIIAPARAMKMSASVNGGRPERYFDADDEVWEALATDNPEDLKVYDNSVALRVEEHIKGINGFLSILCSQVGFDPGTLSFDAVSGLKTATEVISENSKTFETIKNHENVIRDNLKNMVKAILELSAHYGLTYQGQSIESLIANGYNIAIKFDDSIIEDKNAEVNQGIALVGAGLKSKKKFMQDTLGYTPEEAEAELKQIQAEGKMNAVEVTRLFGGME